MLRLFLRRPTTGPPTTAPAGRRFVDAADAAAWLGVQADYIKTNLDAGTDPTEVLIRVYAALCIARMNLTEPA